MDLETSECLECHDMKSMNELIELRCKHSFCWVCMDNYLRKNLKRRIECPFESCSVFIRDRDIRRVLSEEFITKYENMCLEPISKTHKCLLPDCSYIIVYTDPDVQYECPSCTLYNCISCKAAHMFTQCQDYLGMTEQERRDICQPEIERAQAVVKKQKRKQQREILLDLEERDLLPTDNVFTCFLCTSNVCKTDGVTLRECSHKICKICLTEYIKGATTIPVVCPYSYCKKNITDREIQSVLPPEDLKIFLGKCNAFSKKLFEKHFQCQTPDCDAFYDFTGELKDDFTCRSCGAVNCVKCRAIHSTDENCERYQQKLGQSSVAKAIKDKIDKGQVMRCTSCNALLEKVSGCNWVQCSNCKLELCWVLKIPRWGPKGRYDTSGGCKCGVNGRPCDPKCTSSCTPHSYSRSSTYTGHH